MSDFLPPFVEVSAPEVSGIAGRRRLTTVRAPEGSRSVGMSRLRAVAVVAPITVSNAARIVWKYFIYSVSCLADYGCYGSDNRADDAGSVAAVIIAVVLAVELEGVFPRGRAEIVLNHDEEFVGLR